MPLRRAGFTLIELLVVVVIIGVLAALAIPRFSGTQRRAYVGTMTADLRNLAVAEQLYYDDGNTFTYTDVLADLPQFQASEGVTVTVEEASELGWSARAAHAAMTGVECVVYHGRAAPLATSAGGAAGTPTAPGEIACDPT